MLKLDNYLVCTADLVSPKDAKEAAKRLLESGVSQSRECILDCKCCTVYSSFLFRS